MFHKNFNYRRHQRKRSIERKKRITEKVYGINNYYKYDGQYDKGKIHCSCWLCRSGYESRKKHKEELLYDKEKDMLEDLEDKGDNNG